MLYKEYNGYIHLPWRLKQACKASQHEEYPEWETSDINYVILFQKLSDLVIIWELPSVKNCLGWSKDMICRWL